MHAPTCITHTQPIGQSDIGSKTEIMRKKKLSGFRLFIIGRDVFYNGTVERI